MITRWLSFNLYIRWDSIIFYFVFDIFWHKKWECLPYVCDIVVQMLVPQSSAQWCLMAIISPPKEGWSQVWPTNTICITISQLDVSVYKLLWHTIHCCLEIKKELSPKSCKFTPIFLQYIVSSVFHLALSWAEATKLLTGSANKKTLQ